MPIVVIQFTQQCLNLRSTARIARITDTRHCWRREAGLRVSLPERMLVEIAQVYECPSASAPTVTHDDICGDATVIGMRDTPQHNRAVTMSSSVWFS